MPERHKHLIWATASSRSPLNNAVAETTVSALELISGRMLTVQVYTLEAVLNMINEDKPLADALVVVNQSDQTIMKGGARLSVSNLTHALFLRSLRQPFILTAIPIVFCSDRDGQYGKKYEHSNHPTESIPDVNPHAINEALVRLLAVE